MDLQEAIKKTKEDYQDTRRQNEEKKVIEKYGYMFRPDNLDNLTKEDFKSFLLIKNNKHWEGIHRQGNMITQDMDKLRKTLKILSNESKPLKERLDLLLPKNKPNHIKGLGRAIITPILMVVFPTTYGVYNKRTEEGLNKVGLKPEFNRGASFSEKYIQINEVLNNLVAKNEMSLFELDNVWWKITEGYESTSAEEEQETEELSTGFGLEPQLHEFLLSNWGNTPLGQNYEILTEDGDLIGSYYQIKEKGKKIGEIDILAKDKNSAEWVVIELKRGRESDIVVGQTLRYMGWVEKNMVKENESVKGVIIVKEIDRRLEYALFALKSKVKINCFEYNVKFSLKETMI